MEELTYENMLAFVKKYFDMLPTITGPECKPMVMEFFSSDFINFKGNTWTTGHPTGELIGKENIFDAKGWVDHLCEHADQYRAKCYYEPYPLYIAIDERRKFATVCIKEEKLHPVTGKAMKEWYMINGFGFTQEKGSIKFNLEFIIAYPDRFIEAGRSRHNK